MLITILARLQKLLREIKLYITQKNRRLTVTNKKTPLPFEQRLGHLLFCFSFGKLNRFALLGMRDGTLASKSNLVDARTTLTPNSISYLKTSKFWPIAGFLFVSGSPCLVRQILRPSCFSLYLTSRSLMTSRLRSSLPLRSVFIAHT